MQSSSERGFTLPELLASVLLLSLLVGASVFLLRPNDRSIEIRNAQRWNDVAQIMQGINRYVAATGNLPPGISTKLATISDGKTNSSLCKDIVPTYIEQIPLDPSVGFDLSEDNCAGANSLYDSGYQVVKTENNTVTVSAPQAEDKQKISITRTF